MLIHFGTNESIAYFFHHVYEKKFGAKK